MITCERLASDVERDDPAGGKAPGAGLSPVNRTSLKSL
jgi:hypothetical protein